MKLLCAVIILALSQATIAMDTVRVENVDHLLSAIASDRLIIMKSGIYDLSASKTFEKTDYLDYSDNGITIKGIKNLKIIGDGNNPSDVTISSDRTNNYLLSFFGCSNVQIINVSAEHSSESSEDYESGIWFFNQCSKITISNNVLKKGKVGVRVSRSKEFTMKNTEIKECTSGFVEFIDSWTLRIGNSNFAENTGCNAFWYMTGCMDVLVENNSFENNSYRVSRNCRSSKLFSITRSEMVFFKNNTIRNNESRFLGNSEAVRLLQSGNELKRNKFKDLEAAN
jgi:hypothetical protein